MTDTDRAITALKDEWWGELTPHEQREMIDNWYKCQGFKVYYLIIKSHCEAPDYERECYAESKEDAILYFEMQTPHTSINPNHVSDGEAIEDTGVTVLKNRTVR